MKRWLSISCLMLACLPLGTASAKSAACDIQRVPFAYSTYDQAHRWTGSHGLELLLDRRTCDVKRLWTPHVACEFFIGTSHGYHGLSCGRSLDAEWRVRDADDARSYFDTTGAGTHAVVPHPADLKRAYAHLDDDDLAKPIYKEDFPKAFTFVGPQVPVENPDFKASVQPLKYRTMAGEERLGVSGDAVVGCIKYQFGAILRRYQPSEADQVLGDAQKDMASFLGDLRLEPVDNVIERLKDLSTVPIKETVLEPITSCVRH